MAHDFSALLDLDVDALLSELASVHALLATLHEDIAYLRAEEAVGRNQQKHQRIIDEGLRDAFIEKKFLLIRLIETRSNRASR